MSKIQGKPFIELVVDTLGDLKSDFLDLVNGSDKTPEFRSLINASAKITGSDKGKVQYVVLETWSKTYTGYLIYNNTYCVLVAFSSNTQALTMLKIDVAKQTFTTVKEYLDINELRRYLEEASEHITPGEIDSGQASAGKVLAADGEGGASWEDTLDTITPETVQEGDAVQLFGFDAQGNLVKDDMPEGITVDQSVIEDSTNAVAGGAVYDELAPMKEDITELQGEMETKANVDGNYPTMTVGVADQLSPYDEESGDDQDEPFSFQATGTGNGAQPDFSTGSAGLMKEKQGNTVVVNQKAKALNNTNWTGGNVTVSFADGVATFTAIAQYGKLSSQTDAFDMINGHKYLAFVEHKGTIGSFNVYFSSGQYISNLITNSESAFTLVAKVFEYSQASGNTTLHFQDNRTSDWTEQQIKNLIIVDLTQWFNGDIPQDLLDHPENFFRYYQGSLAYNEGELVNANGRYIKCIGMNQWDEEWDSGYYSSNGTPSDYANAIRSKNYCKCIPNARYCSVNPKSTGQSICFYDQNKNFIDRVAFNGGMILAFPSNACYFKLSLYDYGATYNNDVSINLYYEDEPRCLTYEPYKVLTNNDTGTEVLRSAGSVKDTKAPNGTITRRIGSYTFTGSESWLLYSTTFFYIVLTDVSQGAESVRCICSNGLVVKTSQSGNGDTIIRVYLSDNPQLTSESDIASYFPNGTIVNYRLAEPTTEQGTPFSENLVIDDFGSMDFGGTNGVPQGALIFYPVDYKAFIDTLYNYTEGTPSNIALKSDLASDKSELQGVDSQLQNAIGGTLRQLLASSQSIDFLNTDVVDLGELSWSYDSSNIFFSAVIANMKDTYEFAKMLSTLYKFMGRGDTTTMLNAENMTIYYFGGSNNACIRIKNTSYNDATAFKNAMKGVLLAYEKA